MLSAEKITPVIEPLRGFSSPEALFDSIKDMPYSFFLDSASSGKGLGEFSFMGYDPFLVFKSKKDRITLEWQDGSMEKFKANPFFALKDILKRYSIIERNKRLPFTCGAVGYLAYDMKQFVEDLPDRAEDDLDIPDCILGFYDSAVIYDNINKDAYITSSGLPETEHMKRAERQESRLKMLKGRFSSRTLGSSHMVMPGAILRSNFSKLSYMKAVERAKAYIRKGDIYQVNLSQRFETELGIEPFDLYSRLRTASPAPFSSYLNFRDVTIASSSPERFLFKRGGYIETRPIKGTRPRGEDIFSDVLLGKELLGSSKDMAEHVMIVDLERNDLGRICEYGSVSPSEFITLEKYANVFHLVSTITGHLKKGVDAIDCLMATFPGGSITGAPKIRSMEIIDELEPVKRSVYTGAIGYLSFDGNMDTSIVIRTFIIKGKKVYFQVGGGVVADSNPQEEYEETIHKARGLMDALGIGLPAKWQKIRELVAT